MKIQNWIKLTAAGSTVLAMVIMAGCKSGSRESGTASEATSRSDAQPQAVTPADGHAVHRSRRPRPDRSVAGMEAKLAAATTFEERLDAQRGIFQAHRRSKDYERAESAYLDVIALLESNQPPDRVQAAMFSDADLVHRRHDFRMAAWIYDTLIRHYPRGDWYWHSLLGLGNCLMETDRCTEAETALQQVTEGSQDMDQAALAWQQLAICQARKGDLNEATSTLNLMAHRYAGTRHADAAQLTKGQLLDKAGMRDEAQKTYAALVADGKDFLLRMTAHRELKRMEKEVAAQQ